MIEDEAKAFRDARKREVAEARQCAAFFLVSGIDLAEALTAKGEERAAILVRLARLIERERLKGTRRHWSYDLNRHIALKQAYDRLKGCEETGLAGARTAGNVSPVRRRRHREIARPADHGRLAGPR